MYNDDGINLRHRQVAEFGKNLDQAEFTGSVLLALAHKIALYSDFDVLSLDLGVEWTPYRGFLCTKDSAITL